MGQPRIACSSQILPSGVCYAVVYRPSCSFYCGPCKQNFLLCGFMVTSFAFYDSTKKSAFVCQIVLKQTVCVVIRSSCAVRASWAPVHTAYVKGLLHSFYGERVTRNVNKRQLWIEGLSGFCCRCGCCWEYILNNHGWRSTFSKFGDFFFTLNDGISPDCTEQFEVPYLEWQEQIALFFLPLVVAFLVRFCWDCAHLRKRKSSLPEYNPRSCFFLFPALSSYSLALI